MAPDAKAVFKKERSIQFRKDRPATAKSARRGAGASAASGGAPRTAGLSAADAALFEELRAERMKIAKTMGVPPYVVFPDTTLTAMANGRAARMRCWRSQAWGRRSWSGMGMRFWR